MEYLVGRQGSRIRNWWDSGVSGTAVLHEIWCAAGQADRLAVESALFLSTASYFGHLLLPSNQTAISAGERKFPSETENRLCSGCYLSPPPPPPLYCLSPSLSLHHPVISLLCFGQLSSSSMCSERKDLLGFISFTV